MSLGKLKYLAFFFATFTALADPPLRIIKLDPPVAGNNAAVIYSYAKQTGRFTVELGKMSGDIFTPAESVPNLSYRNRAFYGEGSAKNMIIYDTYNGQIRFALTDKTLSYKVGETAQHAAVTNLEPTLDPTHAEKTFKLAKPVGDVTHVLVVTGAAQTSDLAAGPGIGWHGGDAIGNDSTLVLAKENAEHKLMPLLYLRGTETNDIGAYSTFTSHIGVEAGAPVERVNITLTERGNFAPDKVAIVINGDEQKATRVKMTASKVGDSKLNVTKALTDMALQTAGSKGRY